MEYMLEREGEGKREEEREARRGTFGLLHQLSSGSMACILNSC